MPVTPAIDERHLPPLGLRNAWGYNPVTFMALDPRLAPGGLAELRDTSQHFAAAGIAVILDLVFNHTGESDGWARPVAARARQRGLLSSRGSDPGRLINDTGTGNTIALRPAPDHASDSIRSATSSRLYWRRRLPLRSCHRAGPRPDRLRRKLRPFARSSADPVLADRVLIAEPWDVGRAATSSATSRRPSCEWNDRFRDDVRRFWRGDGGMSERWRRGSPARPTSSAARPAATRTSISSPRMTA